MGPTIDIACRVRDELFEYPSLEFANEIRIRPDSDCTISGFASLEEVPGLLLLEGSGDSDDEITYSGAFENLIVVGMMHVSLSSNYNAFPTLEFVEQDLVIYGIGRNSGSVNGFGNLERIEGTLRFKGRNLRGISGMRALTGIGGDLEISETIDQYSRNRLIDQLEDFVGTVSVN